MSNEDFFDFGFTVVDETELNSYQEAQSEIEKSTAEADAAQEKIDALYAAVQPLLNNLKSSPEKDYILWPDRLKKIEAFEKYIKGIYES
jgi:peptidoglycan hydrolase CwlO-like protein